NSRRSLGLFQIGIPEQPAGIVVMLAAHFVQSGCNALPLLIGRRPGPMASDLWCVALEQHAQSGWSGLVEMRLRCSGYGCVLRGGLFNPIGRSRGLGGCCALKSQKRQNTA